MAPQMKETGGGPATGLADDFVKMLQSGLQTGTFGAGQAAGNGALNSTTGIMGVLNGILSNGGGTAGNALQTMISKETDRQAGDLRSRFGAQGGTAFGTGAMRAESMLRAEAAPKATMAINQMQMGALMPLLQMMSGISQLGIPQRQVVAHPNPWMQGLAAFGGFMKNGLPGVGAAMGGGEQAMPISPPAMDMDFGKFAAMAGG